MNGFKNWSVIPARTWRIRQADEGDGWLKIPAIPIPVGELAPAEVQEKAVQPAPEKAPEAPAQKAAEVTEEPKAGEIVEAAEEPKACLLYTSALRPVPPAHLKDVGGPLTLLPGPVNHLVGEGRVVQVADEPLTLGVVAVGLAGNDQNGGQRQTGGGVLEADAVSYTHLFSSCWV